MIQVKATRLCYYGDKRRRVGEQFEIGSEKDFSSNYMELLDSDVRVKKSKPMPSVEEADLKSYAKTKKSKAQITSEEDTPI